MTILTALYLGFSVITFLSVALSKDVKNGVRYFAIVVAALGAVCLTWVMTTEHLGW